MCSSDLAGGKYIFGSPLFNKAVVNVGGGKTFTIEAKNNSAKNIYIQSAKLNGKPYTRSYIDYKDIMRGGKLEFVMAEKPSTFGNEYQTHQYDVHLWPLVALPAQC